MNDKTPAHQIRVRDEENNTYTYIHLMSSLPAPKVIVELFGGMGRITRQAQAIFPKAKIYSFDLDQVCCETIKKYCPSVEVLQQSSLDQNPYIIPDCGVLADFNLLTIKKAQETYREFFEYMFSKKPGWIVLTDSAHAKLHINYKSYGCLPALSSYIELWKKYATDHGYKLKKFSECHYRSIVIVLERV